MRNYVYTGKDLLGDTKKGKLQAENKEQARAKLKRLCEITSIEDKGEVKPDALEELMTKLPLKPKVAKPAELGGFLKRLSNLLAAGSNVQLALEKLSEYGTPEGKMIPYKLLRVVRQGKDLSDAFKENAVYFGKDYGFMIKAGYESGTLPDTLVRIADELEADVKLMKSIKSSMAYPKFLLFAAIAACIGIFGFVLPGLLDMLGTMLGSEPPALTKAVMAITDFFGKWGILLVAVVGGSGGALTWYINKFQRYARDRVMLALPVFGGILRNRDIIRLFRGLGNLNSAKISNSTALKVSLGGVQNLYIRKELAKCQHRVETEGLGLVTALSFCNCIDPMDLQILDIGAETGNLSGMLLDRADEIELDNQLLIKKATSLVEPVAMLFIGTIILTIVVSVYLPMFSIMGQTAT